MSGQSMDAGVRILELHSGLFRLYHLLVRYNLIVYVLYAHSRLVASTKTTGCPRVVHVTLLEYGHATVAMLLPAALKLCIIVLAHNLCFGNAVT